jgi:hypothetical protein
MGARLHLHPVGLNEEEHKILSVAMNVLIAGGCGACYADELSQDTIAVIDVDSEEGRDFYEHANTSHLKVVIAGDDQSYRADGLIRKPLRVQALRNLLTDISEKLLPQARHDTGMPVLSAAGLVASGGRLPNTTLFYIIVNAVSKGELCVVVCGENPHPLLIHGPTRHIYTSMSRQELQEVASQDEQLHVAIVEEFEFMKQAQGFASHRIEKVLWGACETGSLGYAPVNIDVHGEFQLNDWPRYDVKHARPEFLTLTAIATRRPVSFSTLASMTRIPFATLFDFYHAAVVCGVVEHTAVRGDPEPVHAPVVPSLVSRIAKKLGLNFF